MMLLTIFVFACALTIAVAAIATTILPRLDQITRALAGIPAAPPHPLATLVHAERRIAVRRWAAASPAPARFRREAA